MRRLRRQFGMREKAQGADAIVEVDEHDALLGEVFASVHRHPARSEREAAAVDIDDNRQLRSGLRGPAGPNVEIEAILAGRLFAEVMIDVVTSQHLDAFRRLAIRMVDAFPGSGRQRLAPSQLAHRRRCERHAEIGAHAAIEQLARHRATFNGDRVLGNRSLDDLRFRARRRGDGQRQQG